MAESKYFPGNILSWAVMYFEIKLPPKNGTRISIETETFMKYSITIGIKNSKESYAIINRKDGAHLIRGILSSAHGLEKNDPWELENNLSTLGEVIVKKEEEEVGKFKDFDSFIKTISRGK